VADVELGGEDTVEGVAETVGEQAGVAVEGEVEDDAAGDTEGDAAGEAAAAEKRGAAGCCGRKEGNGVSSGTSAAMWS
jgi:hypothetical protein